MNPGSGGQLGSELLPLLQDWLGPDSVLRVRVQAIALDDLTVEQYLVLECDRLVKQVQVSPGRPGRPLLDPRPPPPRPDR